MKTMKIFGCLLVALATIAPLAQTNAQEISESGNTMKGKPNDAIYISNSAERLPLAHSHLEERDVLWEKRIWREIDIKELRNHHFANEKRQFIKILLDAAKKGDVRAYSNMNDEFTQEMTSGEIDGCTVKADTAYVMNVETGILEPVPYINEFNPSSVTRYRIKEVTYFDSRLGRLNTRILGIAPIMNRYDDGGNLIATAPICWFYYDDLRPILAKEPMFSAHSDTKQMSWDDVFESRFFASYITKESNVRDLRLQDIHSGVNVLHESDKIREDLRNREADMFSDNN